MIDEKTISESQSRFKKFIAEGIIKTKQKIEFTDFFIANAEKSLNSANALYDLSTDKDMQQKMGYINFDGFLWVVNASYYSMFYMARAILENEGINIKSDLSVHLITFDAIINFFYINGKLQKKIIEDFVDANEEANELLGKQKADQLMSDYFYEKGKRAIFTYNTQLIVIQNKAKTSIERAKRFNQEIKRIIKNNNK